MPKYDKYHAKWKANMAKCSKHHAKCKVTMPKCSKYHAKWQVLVPNCCKYKANGTGKENQKKSKTWGQKNQKTILHLYNFFWGWISCGAAVWSLNRPVTLVHGSIRPRPIVKQNLKPGNTFLWGETGETVKVFFAFDLVVCSDLTV